MSRSETKPASNPAIMDFASLWAEAAKDPEFLFQSKAEEIAVGLTALLLHEGVGKAELARRLDWKLSRVSKVLGGCGNLTLRTIFDILQAIGYDFDVVARKPGERKPVQPWQRHALVVLEKLEDGL
jgi:hypothetical protein